MLATAHGFERFGGLTPCLLCLKAREIYWLALGVSVLGLTSGLIYPVAQRLLAALLPLVFAGGCAIALFHVGAEQHWWSGPAACGSGGVVNVLVLDLNTALSTRPHAPRCDDIQWSLFGISMAGWNGMVSLALMAISFKVVLDEQ